MRIGNAQRIHGLERRLGVQDGHTGGAEVDWPLDMQQACLTLEAVTGPGQSSTDYDLSDYGCSYLAAHWPGGWGRQPESAQQRSYRLQQLEDARLALVARGDWPESDPGYQQIPIPTTYIDGEPLTN